MYPGPSGPSGSDHVCFKAPPALKQTARFPPYPVVGPALTGSLEEGLPRAHIGSQGPRRHCAAPYRALMRMGRRRSLHGERPLWRRVGGSLDGRNGRKAERPVLRALALSRDVV